MTEPVAYLITSPNGEQQVTIEKPDFGYIEYLYTAEQLQPRVKMTQGEFDEFRRIRNVRDYASTAIRVILRSSDFPNLSRKLFSGSTKERVKSEKEFNLLWYSDNPEETIEIIPKKKWFVISIKKDDEGDYAFLSDIKVLDDWVYSKQHDFIDKSSARAYAFDTKEEAELWTNPLTEAVQLPVEVNND